LATAFKKGTRMKKKIWLRVLKILKRKGRKKVESSTLRIGAAPPKFPFQKKPGPRGKI